MTEDVGRKKGFLTRSAAATGRYMVHRFGYKFIRELGVDNFKKGASGARTAMTPLVLDRDDFNGGLNGRYTDGGVARFAEVMRENKVDASGLIYFQQARRRSAILMFIAAAVFLTFGVWQMFAAVRFQTFMMGFGTSFTSFVLIALGARHDFSRWQIQNRRMGGFREYLMGDGAKISKSKDISKTN